MLTTNDMKRAFEMFGELVGSVKGKMTQRKVNRAIYGGNLVMDKKYIVMPCMLTIIASYSQYVTDDFTVYNGEGNCQHTGNSATKTVRITV
jgi:hypothetical protein